MNANIAEYLRATVLRRGDAVAVIFDGDSLTWSELDARVDALAAGLILRGLHAGDRVALVLGNGLDFVTTYFACARAGLVTVPLNPAYTSPEIAVLLADSEARLVVVESDTRQGGVDAAAALPGCEVVCTADDEWRSIFISGASVALAEAASAPESLALLLFTAGTSGKPKGAMLTHGALRANIDMLLALDSPAAVREDDIVLAVLPMFHVYGLNTVLGLAVAAGATCVITDRFDPEQCADLIAQHGITTVAGAPGMYQAWCFTPRLRERMATVRLLSSGGAPLPARVFDAFQEASGMAIYEGYGMTEAAPVVATTLVSGAPKVGSVGRPLPGLDIRLVDEDGGEVDDGDPGELWVRGPSVFRGYWPDALGGPDAEGWFHSGDVAYLDDDGDLHLVDRRREVILVNGFNVYPREIELAIEGLDGVAETAVVGIPDDRTGEAVLAFVVPRRGFSIAADDVRAHCAGRLARFKCPTVVRVVDALPHSTTGKVAKGRLRDVHGEFGFGS